jgi:ornithine carbamoyltransferase
MKVRHFLTLSDIGTDCLFQLVNKSIDIARGKTNGARLLKGKVVGIYFRGTSTRTRTAFTVGALKLGAHPIQYGPNDLQIITGESIKDTGQVLSGFLDALVIRTNGSFSEMQVLSDQDNMAVINAMSENEHPTQAISDLVTIYDVLGRLEDVSVLYIGEGNNTAEALAYAISQIPGMRLILITPKGYGLSDQVIEKVTELARKTCATIEQHHRIDLLPKNVDVVYTTRWLTMGVPKQDPNWQAKFAPYRITRRLMDAVSNRSDTIFMHDLPAIRGSEVDDEVLDGPQSRAFQQAKHKLTGAMAILEWCINVSQLRQAANGKQSGRIVSCV